MPELPEVETVCRGMQQEMIGKTIEDFWYSGKNLRFPLQKEDFSDIFYKKIIDIKRRAKYIIIELENEFYILIHLGMTGQISFSKNKNDYKIHDHFRLYFSDKFYMNYHDTRRFGFVICLPKKEIVNHKLFSHLAPEPLTEEFDSKYLFTKLKSSNKAIKEFIMDNKKVVGVGNIYASEVLFRSNIHPKTIAKNITEHQSRILVETIKEVLLEAIEAGGSSINDYVKTSGDMGYFQQKLNVYNRENLACKICKNKIEKIKQQGRSTYFCPVCQKG